jgi:hypothetical protein
LISTKAYLEPLDLLIASVGIGHGIDEDDEVFANVPDHRLLGSRQAIGELEDRLGGTGFVGVDRGVEVIDYA